MRLPFVCLAIVVCPACATDGFGSEQIEHIGAPAIPAVTVKQSGCECLNGLVAETPGFRVHCCATAERISELAVSCERLKSHVQSVWSGNERPVWDSRCEVIVHPTVEAYRRAAGPGSARTSGCSTIRLHQGRVVSRRIDLCGDTRECLNETLPHELTHVVLADHFSDRRIPPWADEAIAMLAESPEKLQRRLDVLQLVVASNRTLPLKTVLQLPNGPAPAARDAFYGQSVTLAGVLLERGTSEQLLRFIKQAQQTGYESALREIYAIHSWKELEAEWRRFAGSQQLRSFARHSFADHPERPALTADSRNLLNGAQ